MSHKTTAGPMVQMLKGEPKNHMSHEAATGPLDLRPETEPKNHVSELLLQNLSVGYGKNTCVSGLSGAFSRNGLNLLLGPSGSGKTTLFLTLAGFLPPLSGEILWNSQPWHPSGKVGLAFQSPEQLFFCSTVGEEVEFALTQQGKGLPAEIRAQAEAWLAQWDLDPTLVWQKDPFKLSGGEMRRVALAACTVFQPEVILLDEPLAGLDYAGVEALKKMLVQLSVSHTVIITTHDPEPFLPSAGTILLLAGRTAFLPSNPGDPDAPENSTPSMAGTMQSSPPPEGIWFPEGRAFLKSAINDPSIYPLPDWYLEAVGAPPPSLNQAPMPEAKAVGEFLKSRREGMEKLEN